MTHTIIVAAGLCSAIRPKLLTAFPEERYPNLRITAWGEGHWHIPCPDNMIMPDDDPWVKKHIAQIDVNGALSFAKWVEYVACRAIAIDNGTAGTMCLMSRPLNPKNIKWAAKWDSLPEPGEWRQVGCKHKPPQQDDKPQTQQRRQRQTRRTRQARKGEGWISKLFGGIL